jgi:hypothetical protein
VSNPGRPGRARHLRAGEADAIFDESLKSA